MTRLKHLSLLLWLCALGMAAWVFCRLPLSAITAIVAGMGSSQWLVWSVINALVVWLLTWRWQILTRLPGTAVGFWPILAIRQAGQTVSFLTPGPQFGGEPLQVYWLWKRLGLPIHQALLGLGLDRFFELWVNFTVLLLAALLLVYTAVVPLGDWNMILPALGLLVLATTVFGWVVLGRPDWVVSSLTRLTHRWRHHPLLSRADSHWQALGGELQALSRQRQGTLLSALLLSLAGWLAMLGELWWLLKILDLTLALSGFLLILVATRVAFLLPLPGGIGPLEAAVFWSFQGLGLPLSAAGGLIALMRLRDAVIIGAGLICLYRVRQDV